MEYNEVRKFVAEKGFRTIDEMEEKFSDDGGMEILNSHLSYLVGKNMIRKITYVESNSGPKELFYIPG